MIISISGKKTKIKKKSRKNTKITNIHKNSINHAGFFDRLDSFISEVEDKLSKVKTTVLPDLNKEELASATKYTYSLVDSSFPIQNLYDPLPTESFMEARNLSAEGDVSVFAAAAVNDGRHTINSGANLLYIGGMVMGVLGAVGAGSSGSSGESKIIEKALPSTPILSPQVAPMSLQVKPAMGPFIAEELDLKVTEKPSGKYVAIGNWDKDNRVFNVDLPANVSGFLLFCVSDANGDGLDYIDEESQQSKDLKSDLHTLIYLENGQSLTAINVNPLTELVYQMVLQYTPRNNDGTVAWEKITGEYIQSKYNSVADLFGIDGVDDLLMGEVLFTIDENGNYVEQNDSNEYGRALAIISKAESEQGKSTSEIIALILKQIHDSDGNPVEITSNFTLDITAPVELNLTLAEDTGSSNVDGITNNSTITIAGLESGAIWQYQVDAGNWTNGTLSSFNAISGLHNYSIRQIDSAGNIGNITTLSNIKFDNTAPEILNVNLAADTGSSNVDGITNNSKITVAGLESEATWQYQIDAGNWTNGTLVSFNAISGLHNYSIRQIDSAGNIGNITTLSNINFDNTAPEILNVNLAADTGSSNVDGITNNSTITVAGLESGAIWEYRINGQIGRLGLKHHSMLLTGIITTQLGK